MKAPFTAAMYQPTMATDAQGTQTTFGYDSATRNLTSATANGATRGWAYNADGTVSGQYGPGGSCAQGRTCSPSTASRPPLFEAAQHQPAGAGQTRGGAAIRRGGHLPQRRLGDRLVGPLLMEQNDEWLVGRRYLSAESLALVLDDQAEEGKGVPELEAA